MICRLSFFIFPFQINHRLWAFSSLTDEYFYPKHSCHLSQTDPKLAHHGRRLSTGKAITFRCNVNDENSSSTLDAVSLSLSYFFIIYQRGRIFASQRVISRVCWLLYNRQTNKFRHHVVRWRSYARYYTSPSAHLLTSFRKHFRAHCILVSLIFYSLWLQNIHIRWQKLFNEVRVPTAVHACTISKWTNTWSGWLCRRWVRVRVIK